MAAQDQLVAEGTTQVPTIGTRIAAIKDKIKAKASLPHIFTPEPVTKVLDKAFDYSVPGAAYNLAKRSMPKPNTEGLKQQAAIPKYAAEESYKSLADLQAHGYGKDKKVQEANIARQLTDPFSAPTPGLKLNALAGKLQRVYDDPQYLSLRPENRVRIKGLLYDKYVAPIMKINGVEPPSKEEWLAEQGSEIKDHQEKEGLTGAFLSGGEEGSASAIRLFGNLLHGTASYITSDKGKATQTYKDYQSQIDKVFAYSDMFRSTSDDYHSTFATKDGIAAWTANFGGKMIGEVPAYLAAGYVLGPVVGGATGLVEGAIPSLAEKGAISSGWKLAKVALSGAGDVFAVDKGEGKSTHESSMDAAGAAILGPALHASFSGLGKVFGSAARLSAVDGMRWAASKLAVGGEPMAAKIAEMADHSDGLGEHSTPGQTLALVNENDPAIKQAVKDEQNYREHIARQFHPEKADAAGDKSVWRNLSKEQRTKIRDHIAAETKVTSQNMALAAPVIQTQANGLELTNEAKANPQFAARLKAVEQLTGMQVAAVITRAQATEQASKLGLSDKTRQLMEAVSGAGEAETFDIMHEQAKSLPEDYRVQYDPAYALPSVSGGSTALPLDKFLTGTIKYLEKSPATPSGHVYYESPKMHLLALLDTKAPVNIKAQARGRLMREFSGMTSEKIKTQRAILANHVGELRDTGLLQSEGNVYRSTKLVQGRYRTAWQKELSLDDIPASDMALIKNLTKKNPELKRTLGPVIKELANFKQRAQTPAVEAMRRGLTKQLLQTLSEYQ